MLGTERETSIFSDFGSYSERKRKNKFRAIAKSINEGTMPLWQYTMIHKDARLTTETKAFIINWSEKIKDSLSKK